MRNKCHKIRTQKVVTLQEMGLSAIEVLNVMAPELQAQIRIFTSVKMFHLQSSLFYSKLTNLEFSLHMLRKPVLVTSPHTQVIWPHNTILGISSSSIGTVSQASTVHSRVTK